MLKSSSKREVYSNISIPQGNRKISNNLINHLKELEKEQSKWGRNEIIKIKK